MSDDDLAKTEAALDAPAHHGAQHAAHTRSADDEADLRRAGTHLLRRHDQQQRHGGLDEIDAAGQQRHLAHDLLSPQPAQALQQAA